MKIRTQDIEEGFRRWQVAYDNDPEAFLTPAEQLALPLDEVAETQLAALLSYLPIRPRRLVERCGVLLTEREAERFDRLVRRLVRKKK